MDSTNFDNFYELKKKYNELILLIQDISGETKLKTFIENVEDNDLELIISNFCNSIESDKKIRKLFLNRNERLFSETNNIKLIPSFNLKSFLTKCNDSSYIWECIQLLYAIYRSGNDKYKDLVTKVVGKIEKFNFSDGTKQESESGVDNMIMDIANTLRNNLVSESKANSKVNPIENMIKTSQMISEKYAGKLKSGDISMNDMFSSLGKMINEIDKNTANDKDLQNIDVSDMPSPDELFKSFGLGNLSEMNGSSGTGNPLEMLSSLNGSSGTSNPMEMISSLMGQSQAPQKKNLTPEQEKEMEEFYSKMSSNQFNLDDNVQIIEDTTNIEDSRNILDDQNLEIPDEKDNNNISTPDFTSIFKNMNNNKDDVDLDKQLQQINDQLISKLPEDQQKDLQDMTSNMMNIMKNIAK